jgi:hypothetical protein
MPLDLDRARYAVDGVKSRLTTMNKRPLIIIGVGTPLAIVLLVVLIVVWTSGGGGGGIEPTQIPEARSQSTIDVLGPQLAADPRFASVRLVPSRADDTERLLVMGSVARQSDLDALKARISEARPSVDVDWQVAVAPDDG